MVLCERDKVVLQDEAGALSPWCPTILQSGFEIKATLKSIAPLSILLQSGNATPVRTDLRTHDNIRSCCSKTSIRQIINAKAATEAHRGGVNSPASQPTASVFIGYTAKDATSVHPQVEHSKVRFSNPALPGEMRANLIRCLHTGHIGRSLMEAVLHDPRNILIYPPRNLILKRELANV